jgi:hypothetical protein
LRGDTLEMCKTWVARRNSHAPEITELQLAFFNVSEEAERRSQSAERQQLDQIRTALAAENAAQRQREKAALRRGQRAFAAAVGLFGCVIVGAVGWWKQDWLREQYHWRVVMHSSVLSPGQESAFAAKGGEFSECVARLPDHGRGSCREFHHGVAEERGISRHRQITATPSDLCQAVCRREIRCDVRGMGRVRCGWRLRAPRIEAGVATTDR